MQLTALAHAEVARTISKPILERTAKEARMLDLAATYNTDFHANCYKYTEFAPLVRSARPGSLIFASVRSDKLKSAGAPRVKLQADCVRY